MHAVYVRLWKRLPSNFKRQELHSLKYPYSNQRPEIGHFSERSPETVLYKCLTVLHYTGHIVNLCIASKSNTLNKNTSFTLIQHTVQLNHFKNTQHFCCHEWSVMMIIIQQCTTTSKYPNTSNNLKFIWLNKKITFLFRSFLDAHRAL